MYVFKKNLSVAPLICPRFFPPKHTAEGPTLLSTNLHLVSAGPPHSAGMQIRVWQIGR